MQKSPITSSVALPRLENETVLPNREKLKKNRLRPPGAWEAPGSAQSNEIKVYFWSEMILVNNVFLRFSGVFPGAAAAFSGEN